MQHPPANEEELLPRRLRRSRNEQLLAEIAAFCRRAGIAESTFGRRVVNDGKLVGRLRYGGRITTHTVERVRSFIARNLAERPQAVSDEPGAAEASIAASAVPAATTRVHVAADAAPTHFRFYDNRQKYLLFVHTCNEKWVVSQRIEMELEHIKPRVPAFRLFDAGVGDGTVLTRVMRSMHDRFANVPFYIVGKEISLEDVRLALEKVPDRFYEHPSTVLVMTNMLYSEAAWLRPNTLAGASGLVWHELALRGNTANQFERQINSLQDFLAQNWTVRTSKTRSRVSHSRNLHCADCDNNLALLSKSNGATFA